MTVISIQYIYSEFIACEALEEMQQEGVNIKGRLK